MGGTRINMGGGEHANYCTNSVSLNFETLLDGGKKEILLNEDPLHFGGAIGEECVRVLPIVK